VDDLDPEDVASTGEMEPIQPEEAERILRHAPVVHRDLKPANRRPGLPLPFLERRSPAGVLLALALVIAIGSVRALLGCAWWQAHEAEIEAGTRAIAGASCTLKDIDTGIAGVAAKVCTAATLAEELENEAAVRAALPAPTASPSAVVHTQVAHPGGRPAGEVHDQRAVMRVSFTVKDAGMEGGR